MDTSELLREALANDRGGNAPLALLQYRRLLARDPGNLAAMECYAALLLSLGRYADSAAVCEGALSMDPGSEYAASNLKAALGGMLAEAVQEGRADGVLSASDRMIDLGGEQDPARVEWERSYSRLLLGDWGAGWPLYESRLRLPDFVGQGQLVSAPRWDGGPYGGKTLLVHGEQGYGDTIMMLRYLGRAKGLGGSLLAFVQPPLAPLAATCAGPDRVFDSLDAGPVDFDVQLPMMSLPYALGIDPLAEPPACPYLRVPDCVPNRGGVDSLISGADPPGGGRKRRIGLVWAGRPTHRRDSERSIPPALLSPLADIGGASWFALQREEPGLAPFPGAVPLGGLLETFADTAYAISRMDLLVTVDTSAAHLAGALGVRTMLLVAFLPDWRWLLGRRDSPWYPGTAVFRQKGSGEWEDTIAEVAEELAAALE